MKPRMVIGRRPICDICLPFPNVSSQHCELLLQNGYWHVQDLGSRNGIKINGVRDESRFLLPGDELSVAKHVYQVTYEPSSDTPPPPEEDSPFKKSLMEKAGLVSRKKKSSQSNNQELIGDASEIIRKKKTRASDGSVDDQILDWLDE